jgi:hypothetical protein
VLGDELALAHVHELALAPTPPGVAIGDRNDWSPSVRAEFRAAGGDRLAPYQQGKHDPTPARSEWLLGMQRRIETVFSHLVEWFDLTTGEGAGRVALGAPGGAQAPGVDGDGVAERAGRPLAAAARAPRLLANKPPPGIVVSTSTACGEMVAVTSARLLPISRVRPGGNLRGC